MPDHILGELAVGYIKVQQILVSLNYNAEVVDYLALDRPTSWKFAIFLLKQELIVAVYQLFLLFWCHCRC